MLEKLKRRIPDAKDDGLLMDLLADADLFICAYTGRTEVPEALAGAQVALAALFFNRMGMEGELRHAEGDAQRTVESLPEDIRRQLNPFRLGRTVGA